MARAYVQWAMLSRHPSCMYWCLGWSAQAGRAMVDMDGGRGGGSHRAGTPLTQLSPSGCSHVPVQALSLSPPLCLCLGCERGWVSSAYMQEQQPHTGSQCFGACCRFCIRCRASCPVHNDCAVTVWCVCFRVIQTTSSYVLGNHGMCFQPSLCFSKSASRI